MTRTEFDSMGLISKCQQIWDGTYLDCRLIPGFKLQLWAVDDFFVEVIFCIKTQEISIRRSFHDTNLLGPYLELLPGSSQP